MSSIHINDDKAREMIKEAIDRNLFVEAGAGSGKTTMLVERMVSMVKAGKDISRICAITFTKAAANEFYERFRDWLDEEAKNGDEQAAKALKDIDLCFMGTIDAFCHMVLSEHPVTAGIPVGSTVAAEGERLLEYRNFYIKAVRGDFGEELKIQAARLARYYYKSEELFAYTMKELQEMRNSEFCYVPPMKARIDDALASEKGELLRILQHLFDNQGTAEYHGSRPAKREEMWADLSTAIGRLSGDWEHDLGRISKLIGDKCNEKKGLRINPQFYENMSKVPGMNMDFFTPNRTQKGISWWNLTDNGLLQRINDHKYSVLMEFAEKTKDLVAEDLRKRGKLSYFDNLFYLRNILKKDAAGDGKLIRHIYERHSYFLIDEFQDTNPIQAEIFFYLTAEKPVEDWRACIPKPGSLFIVGDPKQSIYRFRGADVESYLNVKNLFAAGAGEVVELTRNHRSTDELCKWFNKVFQKLLPKETKMQSKFSPIPLKGESYGASLNGAFTYRQGEIPQDSVVRLIQRMADDPGITIQTKDKEDNTVVRPLNYGDFMLITFSKPELSKYIELFKQTGIPFKVEGNTLFGECELLNALSVIFSSVADPYDGAARFAAINLTGCDIDEETLDEYAAKAKGMSPSAVLSFLLDEPWRQNVSSEYMEYAYYALELLRAKELDGTVDSLVSAAAYIKSLANDDEDIERCLQFDTEMPAVHLANLHKVKGLQKPVVILAPQSAKEKTASQCVDYETSPPRSYLFQVKKQFFVLAGTSDYSEIASKEEERLEEETIRQLYVAATRAANALIMPKEDADASEGFWGRLAVHAGGNDIDAFLEKHHAKTATVDDDPHENIKDLYEMRGQDGGISTEQQKNRTYEKQTPSTLKRAKSDKEREKSENPDGEDGIVPEPSATPAETTEGSRINKGRADVMGTLVHEYMRRTVESGGSSDDSEVIRTLIAEFQNKLSEGVKYEEILSAVAGTIRGGGYPEQEPGTPVDVLAELLSADEVHCELPFCYLEEAAGADAVPILWNGVIDVAYKKDGKWHILDYKTNYENDNLGEVYQEQLNQYVQAFKAITGEDTDAKIYSIPI